MTNKIAVIYKSRYGSTKQYAQWIAQEAGADLLEHSQVKINDLVKYDTIVYGGNLHAGKIAGKELIVNNFEKIKEKKLIMFWVGSSSVNDEAKEKLLKTLPENMQAKIKLFGLRGAFDFKKLVGTDRLMVNVFSFILRLKKPEKLSGEDKGFLASLEKPTDLVDKNTINPIIEAIK